LLRYSSSVTVNKPSEVVFRYWLIQVAEPVVGRAHEASQWRDRPDEFGLQVRGHVWQGPNEGHARARDSRVRAGQAVWLQVLFSPIKWEGEYRLAPTADGSGTELSQEGTLIFTGLWRLMEPMAGGEIRTGEIKELEKLKAVAEKVRRPAAERSARVAP
jgi:hypothetical protein